MKAAYDRYWKCTREIMLTLDEFIAEAELDDIETLKAVYEKLADFVSQKKLRSSEVYRYAKYKWCLKNPSAIIAYESGPNTWKVNNCDTAISIELAITEINSEWGFEASQIKIIGTPYYDATDYQFIRFDCRHMTWLWTNGTLYQVYA